MREIEIEIERWRIDRKDDEKKKCCIEREIRKDEEKYL